MDTSTQFTNSVAIQVLGRVFTYQGHVHFVLEVDSGTGMARCSRGGEHRDIVYLPVSEVRNRLEHSELQADTA